jgi:hypothetical protein
VTAPLTRSPRVTHAHRLRSYGVGSFVSPAGAGRVSVQFDADRVPRTVSTRDLIDDNGVPLVLRPPYRKVWPLDKVAGEGEAW